MFACTRIAWAEFRLGFMRRSTGAPGARDFVSLAAFFGLMMFFNLFGWSVREGLWGRVEQVLLGALTAGQPPVRLSYHIDNLVQINANVLEAFSARFPGLSIVPQRTTDGAKGALVLPGLAVAEDASEKEVETGLPWERARTDKRETPFRIDAVPLDAPLWQWILERSGTEALGMVRTPLVVAANRNLFREHFRYRAYLHAIDAEQLVPCSLKRRMPNDVADAEIDKLTHLVLEVRENVVADQGRRTTVPSYQSFRVLWVDSFPTPEQTALVVPLSTYEMLLAVAERQTVDFDTEALDGGMGERIASIRLADVDIEAAGKVEFANFAGCLGATPVDASPRTGGVKQDFCGRSNAGAIQTSAMDNRPSAGIGSCQQLRERAPIRHPRFLNNGHDLLVCTGEHRRLRTEEVVDCAKAAGLPRILPGVKHPGDRLEAVPLEKLPKVEWLGPSRIGIPCGALEDTDLARAKEIRDYRARLLEPNPPAKLHDASNPRIPDPDHAWVEACEKFRSANPGDAKGGGRAVLYLLGYEAATVYPSATSLEPAPLGALGMAIVSYVIGGFSDIAPVLRASDRFRGDLDNSKLPQEGGLDALTRRLLAWELRSPKEGAADARVFRLDPSYESALVRFGVLSLIIEKVSTPIAIGGLAFFLFLSAVILSTAIAHRRRQYGLLLMTGLKSRNIGYIVSLQIVLSCIVGGVFGYAAFQSVAHIVNTLLGGSEIVASARMIIGLDVPSFLPAIDGFTMMMLWAGTALLSVIVGRVVLRLHGVIGARSPIELVRS